MKFLQSIFILLGAVMLIGFSSCVQDELIENTTDIIPNQPTELINTTIFGKVFDDDGLPASNASVRLHSPTGDEVVTTDSDGRFTFLRNQTTSRSAYLTVEHPGHFKGFRRISVIAQNYNYTEIKLLSKRLVGTFSSTNGGEVSTEGMSVSLPAEGVMTSEGQPYSGDVQVYMSYLDPTSEDLAQRMIGDLSGQTSDGRSVSLTTYGMVHVELESPSGDPLQVKSGSNATLHYPIPSEISSRAPENVPLWYYDEELGTWVEEGSAIRNGDRYIGEVSHFSAWNVDFLYDPIEVSGCALILNQNGDTTPMKAQIFVCSDRIGQKGGWLCPDGQFLFYNFPKDEEFQIKLLDACGNELYNETYGPYDENTDLGKIGPVTVTSDVALIQGVALNCDDELITDGHVFVQESSSISGNNTYFVPIDTDGTYSFAIDLCSGNTPTLEVSATDFQTFTTSLTTTIIPGPGTFTVDTLVTCDELDNYFKLDVQPDLSFFHEEVYFFEHPDSGIFIIQAAYQSIEEGGEIHGNGPVTGPGTYVSERHYYSSFNDPNGNGLSIQLGPLTPPNMTIEITQYDGTDPGDVIKGTFSGQMRYTEGQGMTETRIVSGSFKVTK